MSASAWLPSLHAGRSQSGLPRSPDVRNHSASTDTHQGARFRRYLRTVRICEDPGMPVIRCLFVALCVIALTAGCTPGALPDQPPAAGAGTDNAKADEVMRAVRDVMASEHLKSVIVRVTLDGKE